MKSLSDLQLETPPEFKLQLFQCLCSVQNRLSTGTDAGSTFSGQTASNPWAQGTGFGYGGVSSTWDTRQWAGWKEEKSHCQIRCFEMIQTVLGELNTDERLFEFVRHETSLLDALASFFINDSLIDIAEYMPLYSAALKLALNLTDMPSLLPLFQVPVSVGNTLASYIERISDNASVLLRHTEEDDELSELLRGFSRLHSILAAANMKDSFTAATMDDYEAVMRPLQYAEYKILDNDDVTFKYLSDM